ncbi:MAG TPA: fatty acid desaturase [Kofleriaceae bacterium]|jgi:fatty acid desaturase|nr:fatty acid desaturase [Kofleriaceae bacterium]
MHDEPFLARSLLYPQAKYVGELRSSLPADAFQPARSRLVLIPAHVAVIAIATLAIAYGWLPWPLVPVISIVIGTSFACLTFVAHETLHGGVVRGRRAKHLVGWIGFAPFVLSPRLWVAWHDRVHHANANLPGDPDMYPTLAEYRASRRIRFLIHAFPLGGRRWRGGLSLILGFTVQSAHQLIVATTRGFLSVNQRRLAIAETALGLAVWATVAALVGFVPFLFVFVLPLLVGNAIIMAFILTNHSLSPLVSINDPLVTGLSVTTPRWIEWLTLRFGFHVEHHLFPAMSSRHAHVVRALLQAHWPERYQSMPLGKALGELHRTARVYKDAVTLIDPRTGQEFPTLMPALR